MQFILSALSQGGLAQVLVAVLTVGLVTAVALARQGAAQGRPSDAAWWEQQGMDDEASTQGGSRLVGGSRPALDVCEHCGAPGPAHRCAGCSSVAYCTRGCQQADWKQGHKHVCKKLKQERKEQLKKAAAQPGSSNGSAAADGAAGEARAAGGDKERPEESNSQPPVPKQVLFPAKRYAALAAAPPSRPQPLGLANVGNSCYANSLLQALLATPALAAYLVSGEHGRGCRKPSPSDWCVLCELEALARQAYAGGGGPLNPRPLLRHVKRLGKQFCFGRQEDSHELYLRLMEAVEAVQLLEAGGKAAHDLRTRETLFANHAFAGYTRSQVACCSCGHVSRTYECCTSLALEVSARGVGSLEAALQRFAAVERLDGDNRYKCGGCKAYVAADKSTRIEAAPHYLNICLKRFQPGRFGKINSKLAFPERLDLGPYMAAGCVDGDPALYSLYAVVVHIDWGRSTDYGHYIAYVKSGGQWFQCDDARVSPVAAAKVLSAGAYLLFYERQAPRRIVPGALSKAAAATAGPDAAVAAAEAAAAAGERVASPRASSLLRVETAPAALPHLGAEQEMPGLAAAASSAGLSSSSSREQLLLDQAEAQQQAAGALAAGTPQPLHASASEADLPAQRGSGGGVLGSPQEQQEEQEAAAVAARAEVEALLRQHAAQQAGSPRSPASSSDGSSSSGVAPRGNRFDLLCSEEDGSEADSSSGGSSGGDDSDADELHGKSSGSSSTRSSTWCQAGSSRASRSSDWELLEQLPDAAGDSAAAADKPAEEEAGHGSPATLDVPAEAVEQVAEDQAACGSSSSQGPVAPPAPAPAEQAEPDAQQEPRAPGLAQQQQDEQALVSADASADSPAAAAPCCPDHRASLTTVGGCRVLRVSVELPGVQHEEQVDWRLVEAPHADSSACQQMLLRAERWRLALPLPVAVAPGTAVVKRKGHKWTVTMPVL